MNCKEVFKRLQASTALAHVDVEEACLLLAQTGSRVYGTHTDSSDWDFISVMRDGACPMEEPSVLRSDGYGEIDLPFLCVDDGVMNVMCIPKSVWRLFLRLHRREVVEVVSSPCVWLCRDPALLQLHLDVDMLRRTSSWEAKLRFQTAVSRLRRGDEGRARKEMFHAVRYRLFAAALMIDGQRVPNLSCANQWWFDVCSIAPIEELRSRIQEAIFDAGETIRLRAQPIYTDPLERDRKMWLHAREKSESALDVNDCWSLAERAVGSLGPLTRAHCHLCVRGDLMLIRHLSSFYAPVTVADASLAQWSGGLVVSLSSRSIIATSARALADWDGGIRDAKVVSWRPLSIMDAPLVHVYWYGGKWVFSDGFEPVNGSFVISYKDHLRGLRISLAEVVEPLLAPLRGDFVHGTTYTFALLSRVHRGIQYRAWDQEGDSLIPWPPSSEWRACEEGLCGVHDCASRLAEMDAFQTGGMLVRLDDGSELLLRHPVLCSSMFLTPEDDVGPLNVQAVLDPSLALRVVFFKPAQKALAACFPRLQVLLDSLHDKVHAVILDPLQAVLQDCRQKEMQGTRKDLIARSVAKYWFQACIFKILKDPSHFLSIEEYFAINQTALKAIWTKAREMNLLHF